MKPISGVIAYQTMLALGSVKKCNSIRLRVILMMAGVAMIGICASEAAAANQTNKISTTGYKSFNPFDLSANQIKTSSSSQQTLTSTTLSKAVVTAPEQIVVQNKCRIPPKPHHRSPHKPHC